MSKFHLAKRAALMVGGISGVGVIVLVVSLLLATGNPMVWVCWFGFIIAVFIWGIR
jgi:low temperature requirement protein LtrA